MCGASTNHFRVHKTEQDGNDWRQCLSCFGKFYSKECYEAHRKGAPSKCHTNASTKWRCLRCDTFFKRVVPGKEIRDAIDPAKHVCTDEWCNNCSSWASKQHECYMKPLDPIEPSEKYLWCDYECTQESGVHEVNFAATHDFHGNYWKDCYNIKEWVTTLLA